MEHGSTSFKFSLSSDPSVVEATVIVSSHLVDALYNQALITQKDSAHTYGFAKGATPLHYIESNFRPNLLEQVKESLLNHGVMSFLWSSLYNYKIPSASKPHLKAVTIEPHQDACFTFTLNAIAPDKEERWKKLSLRAPERKNYKDIDRQVESFIKTEQDRAQNSQSDSISFGDWVCFDLILLDKENNPILPLHKDELWVKISDEDADIALQELFLGKKKGEAFVSTNNFLQEHISTTLPVHYSFQVTIKDFIPHNHVSFEQFKHHFGLKNNKELHQKLIEVFSFRNDLSQRRETVEAIFKLLFKHYIITLSPSILEQQRELVLAEVHSNPDYHVYKAQSDFKEKVRLLAEKQLKELVVIDTICYQEELSITHDDVVAYLNLAKRPRTKEFIHFGLPITKSGGHEIAVSSELLKLHCLREKTINHIINHLTKKA